MKRRAVAVAVSAALACVLFALCGCTEAYNPALSMKDPQVEADALIEPGTLNVGVNTATYPMAGEANGRMTGLEVDVAAAVAQDLGLKVKFVDVGADAAEALTGGQIDVAMGMEADDAEGLCWVSEPYAPAAIALFSMDEGAKIPKKSANPTIAAQTSSLSAWLVTRQYGSEALQADDELKAVFQLLADGEVPYVAADAVVGAYVINSMSIDAHIIGLMQEAEGYCIAAPESNTALQLAITQALSEIGGNGVLDVVYKKWTGGGVDLSGVKLTSGAKAEASRSGMDVSAGSGVSKVGANAVSAG